MLGKRPGISTAAGTILFLLIDSQLIFEIVLVKLNEMEPRFIRFSMNHGDVNPLEIVCNDLY